MEEKYRNKGKTDGDAEGDPGQDFELDNVGLKSVHNTHGWHHGHGVLSFLLLTSAKPSVAVTLRPIT